MFVACSLHFAQGCELACDVDSKLVVAAGIPTWFVVPGNERARETSEGWQDPHEMTYGEDFLWHSELVSF